ncbi:MAG: hypothetical protein Q9212_003829 [Teloschistes hypoglaucus]
MAIIPATTATAFGSILRAMLILLVFLLLYALFKAFYNIYLHPLSTFPGPKAAAATKIPVAYVSWIGRQPHWQLALHEKYDSDVVRISPDELSFISASAWKDIYASRRGNPSPFTRDLGVYAGVQNILTANDADHSRVRRLLSHAFSDKALRDQEPIIQTYVDDLMTGLRKHQGNVNLADWFSWTTFDVIGDLAFGEPFDCLKETTYQPWVAMIINSLKYIAFLSVLLRFPPSLKLAIRFLPAKARQARIDHERMSREKVERRLKSTTDRPDFLSHIIRHNGTKGGMSQEELHQNSALFITAGSDSTASLLAGAVWSLLKNPIWMQKVKDEVRSKFTKVQDISLQETDELTILHAVVLETFRMYPPAVTGQPKVSPPQGDFVSGFFVPPKTGVTINQYAAGMSQRNFTSPRTFAPSRWLDDAQYKDDKLDVVQPFSVGTRNCIGKKIANAEIALVLTRLFWEFDVVLARETDKEWHDQDAWFTWKKKPLLVQIRERESL